jgi:hypothetical protein
MPSAILEPAITAINRLQIYALDCTATCIGPFYIYLRVAEWQYRSLCHLTSNGRMTCA